jgi:hypothetical protein
MTTQLTLYPAAVVQHPLVARCPSGLGRRLPKVAASEATA